MCLVILIIENLNIMSSANKKNITPQEAIPIIKSDIFSQHDKEKFAMGVLSAEDVLSYEPGSIAHGYLQLRANVYIDQTNMLNREVRRSDGVELDENDERSAHFVILEKRELGKIAVIACMRLIVKTPENDSILPIEEFFPDSFSSLAPENSAEVSRLISCHENAKIKRNANLDVMRAGVAYAIKNDLGPVYGVIEPILETFLNRIKLPITRIADPKNVPEYNDDNLGIEIDKFGFRRHLGEKSIDQMMISSGSFLFWGENNEDRNE